MTKSEFSVLPNSSLIGKTLRNVEKEYGVRIDHIHNPRIGLDSRKKADPYRKIDARLIIKVEGEWKNVSNIITA
ncbi:hypothetical protein BEH94_08430 [Candidatus Altiarchaeales archaeon WOR_SM1_SCG]|nr:hypothetical protein BEH94_08430 [Candidatus Altiarchaeales archaeon WOR_SM1_SCG]